jgi:hypothetical protein
MVAPIIGADADAYRADLYADTTWVCSEIDLCTSWRCGKN